MRHVLWLRLRFQQVLIIVADLNIAYLKTHYCYKIHPETAQTSERGKKRLIKFKPIKIPKNGLDYIQFC